MSEEVIYQWEDFCGDKASLEVVPTDDPGDLAVCFSRGERVIQYLSAGQARELAAALLKWAGAAEAAQGANGVLAEA